MSIRIKWREDRKRYEVDYFFNGKRRRPLFLEKPEAENFKRKLELGLKPEDQLSITLNEAGQKYFEKVSKRKSKGSQRNERRYINLQYHFMTYERGIERLSSVRLEDMESFRDWLVVQKEYDDKPMNMGPKTINRCLAVMKHFYVQHIRWKNIKETPCQFLEFLQADDKDRAAATGEQYLAALEKAPDWFKAAFQFMYLTGAPSSCLERMVWNDVDFENRIYVMLRKKGKLAKWKRIPMRMTDIVFSLFILLRNKWPDVEGPVFRDAEGRPLTSDRMGKAGTKAFTAAGHKGITNYCMRHALASDMTAANIATEIVRQAMGHSSISTTQRYANKLPAQPIVSAIDSVRNSGGKVVANAAKEQRIGGGKK